MILFNKQKTIILWGCQITNEAVKAELGYFGSGISEEKSLLLDTSNINRVLVIVPVNAQRMILPGKAQNVILGLSVN